MKHDSSNPFHTLAVSLTARESSGADRDARDQAGSGRMKKATGSRSGGPVSNSFAPKASGKKSSETGFSELEDTELFLNSVASATPLEGAGAGSQRGGSEGHTPFAEALAAREKQADKTSATRSGVTGGDVAPAGSACSAARQSGRSRAGSLNPGPKEDDALSMAEALAPQENMHTDNEGNLFAKAMRGVTPVTGKGRDIAAPSAAPDHEPGGAADPAKALRDLLEGRVEFALHHTDEYMEGHVVGVDPLLMGRLRGGQFSPEAHIDLHGQNVLQACDALTWFIKNAYQRGLRTVLVVTGRGKNSPDGLGVLRSMLQQWLCKDPLKRVVLAFCTAKSRDGGPGAVYVLLRKYKKSRGKIVWERIPSDEDFI